MKNFKIASRALIFAIFLANRVKSGQTRVITFSTTREVTTLSEDSRETVSALQIRQIRTTSEATPAASAGNNLNVVGVNVPSNSPYLQENFQAISTIYEIENKKDKKSRDEGKGNVELLSYLNENISKNNEENSARNIEDSKATNSLILNADNYLEVSFKDTQRNLVKIHNDAVFFSDKPDSDDYNFSDDSDIVNIFDKWNYNINKRNAVSFNHSDYNKVLLQNNDNEKNTTNKKIDQNRFEKKTLVLVNKMFETATSSTTANSASTVPVLPLTTLIFKDPPATLNMTFEIVTEKNARTSYDEDWFDAKDRTKIRFGGLPQTETYLIPSMKLEDGFYPFGFMSEFFSLIYPFEFPVGLIKDIMWDKFNFPYSFLQSIKVESTFLGFIVFFACIALVIPSYLCILGMMALCSTSSNDSETETGALFPESAETDCGDRALVFVTLLVVLICCVLISGMIINNEQAQAAVADSGRVVKCACADIYAWLSAAAREIHHSIVPPVDLVVHAFTQDLRNVETLLGEPIQQAISAESGVDLVLDSLADIVAESEDLSTKITLLRDVSAQASSLATVASEKIRDLSRQLDNLKRHCVKSDVQLCDTLNSHSLELKIKFNLVLQEKQLLHLRTLGVMNLTQAVDSARKQFRTLPSAISNQTAKIREDILEHIESRSKIIHSSSQILHAIVRHLTAGLHTIARQLESRLITVQKLDFWRWILMIACATLFYFVMMLMFFAMMCGCGKAKVHAKRTLQASSVWLCLTSLSLWAMISAIFLFAGHAEVYVCHALWDSPHYETLSALLDRPSPLLFNDEGIFDAMFRGLKNVTIDVSVRDALRDCERNRPAFTVFQLDKVLDVNKETSYFEWNDLQTDFGRLSTTLDVSFLKTISANFSKLLNEVLMVSDVNLAKYRIDYNGPLVGKDLPSLVDQLGSIAGKVSDLNTAGRLETLAIRTQRLLISNIKPMEELRTDLVYKLTELELQLMPFRRKLNISLSHIHTAQYYIDNQGDIISQKKVSVYVSRLISHATGWRTHVLTSVGQRAARCRPLYDVFDAARSLLCTRYISSLHGWWLCGFLLGIVWCTTLTPLCVRLWRVYRHKMRAHDAMLLANLNSGQQETPTTAVCDDNWNSPDPPSPPRNDSW